MKKITEKRPRKKTYQLPRIAKLKKRAVEKVKEKMLPNDGIIRIVLVGSSVLNSFGEYDAPGYRGSLFSDFDFVIFTEDDYEIPDWFTKSDYETPFSDRKIGSAFRNKNFIEGKHDADFLFIKRSDFEVRENKIIGEKAGMPMFDDSKNRHLLVYKKK